MNYDRFVAKENSFLKKHGNIYISEEQNNILKKYDIYVDNYKTIQELICYIEEIINSSYGYHLH